MRVVLLSASLLLALAACKPAEPEAPIAEAETAAKAGPSTQPESTVQPEPSTQPDSPEVADAPVPAPAAISRNYQCGERVVQATFEGESATVVVDGQTLTLPHVPSGSGARYADGAGNEIFAKGEDEALLMLAGEGLGTCMTQSAAAAAASADHPLAREACLDAVAKATNLDRKTLKVTDVLWAEAGVGVTIEVPGADAPWSCLASEDGKVQGAAYTGSEGAL